MRLIRNRPIIQLEDKSTNPVENVNFNIENEIAKQRNFQQDKYIDFVKRFIKDRCEYDYQRMMHIEDIRDAYNAYMTEHHKELNSFNVNYSLTPSDIPKLDNRFEFKLITTCKWCRKKQFKGCCDKYLKADRTKLSYIINLKLKD